MTYVAPGVHLLIDFWECECPESLAPIELAMREAAEICGATVLEVKLHHFGEGAGITGVAILAESHISLHTWPETGYIAIDIFMCGRCDPQKALPVFEKAFRPKRRRVQSYQRG